MILNYFFVFSMQRLLPKRYIGSTWSFLTNMTVFYEGFIHFLGILILNGAQAVYCYTF